MYIRPHARRHRGHERGAGIAIAAAADEAAIDAFVDAQPAATIYHRTAILRAVRRAGGLEVACFVARRPEAGNAIAGVLPVALTRSVLFGTYATSLPYFNYGGVLVAQ